ncbi:MAG: serine hydrolase [Bacteroidetes bacterium]|nr:MAG: serine hydrolase [Bacteroidota bacterium]
MKNKITHFILILLITGSLYSCKVGRFFVYNFADISDYKKFPSREIKNDSAIFTFSEYQDEIIPEVYSTKDTLLEPYFEDEKTVAFIIIHNDTIKYERYFEGYDETSIVPSFSMAKSVLSILIGCAIDDGLIQSTNEPVTNYIPELKENGFDKVTILHLLQMTSGLKFNEGYFNPFGEVATFYYGTNLRKAIAKSELEVEPGERFDYVSGNPQILGLVLERALKDKTISEYFQEKLWTPLGMEYDASWSIDRKKNGLEKTFCCINARARDFAKIGRLYLNKGNWNGEQIVPENWVSESTKVDTTGGSVWYYQYQWWLPSLDGDFVAEGILGQFIYVNPTKDLIIVRLGKKHGDVNWAGLFVELASGY